MLRWLKKKLTASDTKRVKDDDVIDIGQDVTDLSDVATSITSQIYQQVVEKDLKNSSENVLPNAKDISPINNLREINIEDETVPFIQNIHQKEQYFVNPQQISDNVKEKSTEEQSSLIHQQIDHNDYEKNSFSVQGIQTHSQYSFLQKHIDKSLERKSSSVEAIQPSEIFDTLYEHPNDIDTLYLPSQNLTVKEEKLFDQNYYDNFIFPVQVIQTISQYSMLKKHMDKSVEKESTTVETIQPSAKTYAISQHINDFDTHNVTSQNCPIDKENSCSDTLMCVFSNKSGDNSPNSFSHKDEGEVYIPQDYPTKYSFCSSLEESLVTISKVTQSNDIISTKPVYDIPVSHIGNIQNRTSEYDEDLRTPQSKDALASISHNSYSKAVSNVNDTSSGYDESSRYNEVSKFIDHSKVPENKTNLELKRNTVHTSSNIEQSIDDKLLPECLKNHYGRVVPKFSKNDSIKVEILILKTSVLEKEIETNVSKKMIYVKNGVVHKCKDITQAIEVQFDGRFIGRCFYPNVIWIGDKPHCLSNDSETVDYYDIPARYYGTIDKKHQIIAYLDGSFIHIVNSSITISQRIYNSNGKKFHELLDNNSLLMLHIRHNERKKEMKWMILLAITIPEEKNSSFPSSWPEEFIFSNYNEILSSSIQEKTNKVLPSPFTKLCEPTLSLRSVETSIIGQNLCSSFAINSQNNIEFKMKTYNEDEPTSKVKSCTSVSNTLVPSLYPDCLVNWHGAITKKLLAEAFTVKEKLVICAQIAGCEHIIPLSIKSSYYENGNLIPCKSMKDVLNIRFDARLDGTQYSILLMYVGEKPSKLCRGNEILYYDIPSKYYGHHGDEHQLIAFVEEVYLPLKLPNLTKFCEYNRKNVMPTPESNIKLHIRCVKGKEIKKWNVFFSIVQLDDEKEKFKDNFWPKVFKDFYISHSLSKEVNQDDKILSNFTKEIEIRTYSNNPNNLPKCLLNWQGTIKEIHNEKDRKMYENFIIVTEIRGEKRNIFLSKDSLYVESGRVENLSSYADSKHIQFDAYHCGDEYRAMVIWIGEKPSRIAITEDMIFYYDIPSKYYGYSDKYHQLIAVVEGVFVSLEIKNSWCFINYYGETINPYLGNHINLHLRKTTANGIEKWCVFFSNIQLKKGNEEFRKIMFPEDFKDEKQTPTEKKENKLNMNETNTKTDTFNQQSQRIDLSDKAKTAKLDVNERKNVIQDNLTKNATNLSDVATSTLQIYQQIVEKDLKNSSKHVLPNAKDISPINNLKEINIEEETVPLFQNIHQKEQNFVNPQQIGDNVKEKSTEEQSSLIHQQIDHNDYEKNSFSVQGIQTHSQCSFLQKHIDKSLERKSVSVEAIQPSEISDTLYEHPNNIDTLYLPSQNLTVKEEKLFDQNDYEKFIFPVQGIQTSSQYSLLKKDMDKSVDKKSTTVKTIQPSAKPYAISQHINDFDTHNVSSQNCPIDKENSCSDTLMCVFSNKNADNSPNSIFHKDEGEVYIPQDYPTKYSFCSSLEESHKTISKVTQSNDDVSSKLEYDIPVSNIDNKTSEYDEDLRTPQIKNTFASISHNSNSKAVSNISDTSSGCSENSRYNEVSKCNDHSKDPQNNTNLELKRNTVHTSSNIEQSNDDKLLPECLKNWNGILVPEFAEINSSKVEKLIIKTSVLKNEIEINVSKKTIYVKNGVVHKCKDIRQELEVQFDGYSNGRCYQAKVIWNGDKPYCVSKDNKTVDYYDIPARYYGTIENDNQIIAYLNGSFIYIVNSSSTGSLRIYDVNGKKFHEQLDNNSLLMLNIRHNKRNTEMEWTILSGIAIPKFINSNLPSSWPEEFVLPNYNQIFSFSMQGENNEVLSSNFTGLSESTLSIRSIEEPITDQNLSSNFKVDIKNKKENEIKTSNEHEHIEKIKSDTYEPSTISPSEYPECLVDWHGTITKKCMTKDSATKEKMEICAKIAGCDHVIPISMKRSYYENGNLIECKSVNNVLHIRFDARLDGKQYSILLMYVGEKPLKICTNEEIYHYDIPSKYYGLHDENHQLIALIEGSFVPLKLEHFAKFCEYNSKKVMPSSENIIKLHMKSIKVKETFRWKVNFLIVQLDEDKEKFKDCFWPKDFNELNRSHNITKESKHDEKNVRNVSKEIKLEACSNNPNNLPKCLINWQGTIKAIHNGNYSNNFKDINIVTEIKGEKYNIFVTKNSLYVESGRIEILSSSSDSKQIQFDAYLTGNGYHAVVMWIGEKPSKIMKTEDIIMYYDVPSKYYSCNDEQNQLIAVIEGFFVPLEVKTSWNFINSYGEIMKPYSGNHVNLHLRKTIANGVEKWLVIFSILQQQKGDKKYWGIIFPDDFLDIKQFHTKTNENNHHINDTDTRTDKLNDPTQNISLCNRYENLNSNFNDCHENKYLNIQSKNVLQNNLMKTSVDFPGYLQSWPAILVPIFTRDGYFDVLQHFLVQYNIAGCAHETICSKTRMFVNNGVVQKCEVIKSILKVHFDARLNADGTGYLIDPLWVGSKPSVLQNGDSTKYFDIPAKYYGLHENHKAVAMVEDQFVPISVNMNRANTIFYNSIDKKSVSLVTQNSLLTMHLMKNVKNSVIKWKILLTIVHSIGEMCAAENINWPQLYPTYDDTANQNKNNKFTSSDIDIECNEYTHSSVHINKGSNKDAYIIDNINTKTNRDKCYSIDVNNENYRLPHRSFNTGNEASKDVLVSKKSCIESSKLILSKEIFTEKGNFGNNSSKIFGLSMHIDPSELPGYLKDWQGTLVPVMKKASSNILEQMVLKTEIKKHIYEFPVGNEKDYVFNGTLQKCKNIKSVLEVQFDAYINVSLNSYLMNLIWIGEKPTFIEKEGNIKEYFDVPGKYYERIEQHHIMAFLDKSFVPIRTFNIFNSFNTTGKRLSSRIERESMLSMHLRKNASNIWSIIQVVVHAPNEKSSYDKINWPNDFLESQNQSFHDIKRYDPSGGLSADENELSSQKEEIYIFSKDLQTNEITNSSTLNSQTPFSLTMEDQNLPESMDLDPFVGTSPSLFINCNNESSSSCMADSKFENSIQQTLSYLNGKIKKDKLDVSVKNSDILDDFSEETIIIKPESTPEESKNKLLKTDDVYDQEDNPLKISQRDSYSYSDNLTCESEECKNNHDDSEILPKVLINWNGQILKNNSGLDKSNRLNYIIQTKVRGKTHNLIISRKELYCENEDFKPCNTLDNMSNIKFDAYLNNNSYIISVMWIGDRPRKIISDEEIYYYNIPSRYYCYSDKCHYLISLIDGIYIPITLHNSWNFFSFSGEKVTPLAESIVYLHMKKTENKGKIKWAIFFSIVDSEGINNESIINSGLELSEDSGMSQDKANENNNDRENKVLYIDIPKCLINWHGTISAKYENEGKNCIKHLLITTKIKEKNYEIFVPKEESYFENEVLKSCKNLIFKRSIKFDACLTSKGYCVLVMWTEDKPKTLSMENNEIKYYDVLCKYYGFNESKHQLIAVIDGYLIPLESNHSWTLLKDNGENVVPASGDFILSHLKKTKQNGLVTWTVLLSIKTSEKGNVEMFWPISFSYFKLMHISGNEIDIYNNQSNTIRNEKNIGKVSRQIDKIQLPDVLKDCDGTLIPIFRKDNPDIVEYCILKTNIIGCSYISNIQNINSQYIDNGVLRNLSHLESKRDIRFDAHRTVDGDGYAKNLIWIGKKPNQLGNSYYDIPAKYYGFKEEHQILVYIKDTFVPIEIGSFKVSNSYYNSSDKILPSSVIENSRINAFMRKKQGKWKLIYAVPYRADNNSVIENIKWPQSLYIFDSSTNVKVDNYAINSENLKLMDNINMPQDSAPASDLTSMSNEESLPLEQNLESLEIIKNGKCSKQMVNCNTFRMETKHLGNYDFVNTYSLENKDFLSNNKNVIADLTIDDIYGFSPSKMICRSLNRSVLIKRNSFYLNQVKIKATYPLNTMLSLEANVSAVVVPIPDTSFFGHSFNHQAIISWQGKKPKPEDITKHMPSLPEKVDNLQVPIVINESICISLNDTVNTIISRNSFYINGIKINENLHLNKLVLLDMRICGLVLTLKTPVEKFGITITHESVVTWQGVKPNNAVCNFHILNHERFNNLKLGNLQELTQCKSISVYRKNIDETSISKQNSYSCLDLDNAIKAKSVKTQAQMKEKKNFTQKSISLENVDLDKNDKINSNVESKGSESSLRGLSENSSLNKSNFKLLFKEIVKDNIKELNDITYMSGSYLNTQRNIGFIQSQKNIIIFNTAYLFYNGIRVDGKDMKYGEQISCYQFPLEQKVDLDDLSVTHVAAIAFVGMRPIEADKIIGYWQNVFSTNKAEFEYDAAFSASKTEQTSSTVSIDLEKESYAENYQKENKASIPQSQVPTGKTNMSKEPSNILPSFKAIFVKSAKPNNDLMYMAGVFVSKRESFGIMKTSEKVIIFHMDFLFQDGIKSNKNIKVGENMACYGFLIDNQVNVGNLFITHIATVVFTGKKPADTNEIISSWNHRFFPPQSKLISSGIPNTKGKKHSDESQSGNTPSLDFLQTEDQYKTEDLNEKSEITPISHIQNKLYKLGTFVGYHLLEKAVSDRVELIYHTGRFEGFIYSKINKDQIYMGYLESYDKKIMFHKMNLYINGRKFSEETIKETSLKKGPSLNSFCFHLKDAIIVNGYSITHFAAIVFDGKQPAVADEIISYWYQNIYMGAENSIPSSMKISSTPKDKETFTNVKSTVEFECTQDIQKTNISVRNKNIQSIADIGCIQNVYDINFPMENKNKKTTAGFEHVKNIQETNIKQNIKFDIKEKFSATNFRKLMEKSKSSDDIEYFIYSLNSFVLLQNSICIIETNGKTIAFHLNSLYVNGEKTQRPVEELKNAKNMKAYTNELLTGKVMLDEYCLTHAAFYVCITNNEVCDSEFTDKYVNEICMKVHENSECVILDRQKMASSNTVLDSFENTVTSRTSVHSSKSSIDSSLSNRINLVGSKRTLKNCETPLENIRCNIKSSKKISNSDNGNIYGYENSSTSEYYGRWVRLSSMDLYVNQEMLLNAKDSKIVSKGGNFLMFKGSLGFWKTTFDKNVVFHKENLYINKVKLSHTLQKSLMKIGKVMHGKCFELEKAIVIDKVPVSFVSIIAYSGEMHSNISDLITKWNVDALKTIKATSKLFLAETNQSHSGKNLQNKEELSYQMKLNKDSLRDNPTIQGQTSNTKPKLIKDVTGQVLKIMKKSILIQFSSNPINVHRALAKCSLSNVYLDGTRYGNTTKKEIDSHLSSKKSLHGMVKKLETSCIVNGIKIHYEMSLGWIGSKPMNNLAMDYDKVNQKQSQTNGIENTALASSAGANQRNAKEKQNNVDQSKGTQYRKNDIPTGIIYHIEPDIVKISTKTGKYFQAKKDRCFLYNVCLQAVNLTHVLMKDLVVEYDICVGDEVKGIWLPSSSISLDSEDLYYAMCSWCDKYNVPESTKYCLLEAVEWEPVDLTMFAPTVDSEDDTEIATA